MIKKDKSNGYRIRFNNEQIRAILSVASIIDNKQLGSKTISNFGYIVYKLQKILDEEEVLK